MFTGLIEEIGTIARTARRGPVLQLTVSARTVLEDIRLGDSIAIAGVCQTVTAAGSASFTVEAVPETMRRTTLGSLGPGAKVNLERSLKVGDRLGGHFVFGHVEAVGELVSSTPTGEGRELSFSVPALLDPFIVGKGSVAVDGASLTVTFARPGAFGVAVIPHTLAATTLGGLAVGGKVNIETDVLARYVHKAAVTLGGSGLTMDSLRENGFE